MRHAWIAQLGMLLSIASPTFAAEPATFDLSKIDRTPPKLPTLQTDHPEYCLLVFGLDAHKKIWLVQDGNTLYVDRNGNGDLTEPDKRIAATPDYGDPKDGVFLFKAGDIPDGQLTHKDLRLYRFNLDYLKDEDPRLKNYLTEHSTWRGGTVQIDLEMPGQRGGGVEGRVVEQSGWHDDHGLLQFGHDANSAPIVHFGGLWHIVFYNPPSNWHAGATAKPYLAVGTPGLGTGTTAFVQYQGLIPADTHPTLTASFSPAAEGQSAIQKSYALTKRCCAINLYGNVDVPTGIGLGTAHVELSLTNWPGVTVAPTAYEIPIQAAAASATDQLQPVSSRLKQTLPHSSEKQEATIVEVQFSPDGRRVIAGDYPGGVVNIWDAETTKRSLELETGAGYRSSYHYFAVSREWKLIYAPTRHKDRKNEKVEVDGKSMLRWSFDDSIRVFDLETGKLLNSFKHSPPREILSIDLSPDGQYFLSSDGVPGEYEKQYRRTASLWHTATGSHRDMVENSNGLAVFSSDNKRLVINLSAADASGDIGLKIFDLPDLASPVAITLPLGPATVWPCQFSPDAKVLAARVEVYPHKGDWQHGATSIKFYDAANGRELFSTSAVGENAGFYPVKWVPDSRTLVAVEQNTKAQHAWLNFIDLPQKEVRRIDFGEDKMIPDIAFHPNGKWIAAAIVDVTKDLTLDDDTQWKKLPQPRIQIIDIATGKTLETLVAPQCYIASMAFSPDGKTLATSGPGQVLLWDFSDRSWEPRP